MKTTTEQDFNPIEDFKIKGCADIDKLVIPIYPEWIEYKGEVYVSQLNFEATEKSGKPMFDLSYCMTKALNQSILKTVQYDKNKFKMYDMALPSPPTSKQH